jgi:hypothetical protein
MEPYKITLFLKRNKIVLISCKKRTLRTLRFLKGKSFWIYFTKNLIEVPQNWQFFLKMDIGYKTLIPLKLGYYIPKISCSKSDRKYPFLAK